VLGQVSRTSSIAHTRINREAFGCNITVEFPATTPMLILSGFRNAAHCPDCCKQATALIEGV
jgi:hypothetical protein